VELRLLDGEPEAVDKERAAEIFEDLDIVVRLGWKFL